MTASHDTPIALTIAGSDCSGGAGIQADLKTFAAHAVYGASVITALTAQNTLGVTGVLAVPQAFITSQFDAVTSDLDVKAMKTGMLGDAETVATVSGLVSHHPGVPLVVDPVMVSASGHVLLAPDAIDAVRTQLFRHAVVVTPNLAEAAALTGGSVAQSEAEMVRQAEALLRFGPHAVLIKGGHGEGPEAVDVLHDGATPQFLRAERIATKHTHGTGCTLSAAIAANLARGLPLLEAVVAAKTYVWQALVSAIMRPIGRGSGPVDHLFALRKSKYPQL